MNGTLLSKANTRQNAARTLGSENRIGAYIKVREKRKRSNLMFAARYRVCDLELALIANQRTQLALIHGAFFGGTPASFCG